MGYGGPLTNALQVAVDEGITQVYTHVVLAEMPVAGIVVSSSSPTALGQPTFFTASVATGSNVLYSWAFGDGSAGIGSVAAHTYPTDGMYTASVTATNMVSLETITTIVDILPIRAYLPLVE
jgi:PKD repeat protein